tara:strand:- start:317 stop:490 length:174 start_codon:yes stop_codon:yes gene_type:complete
VEEVEHHLVHPNLVEVVVEVKEVLLWELVIILLQVLLKVMMVDQVQDLEVVEVEQEQ